MNDQQLTEHFFLSEFTASQTATRLGIDNTPSPEILENLKVNAAGMEEVRTELGDLAISVSSGFRCDRLNEEVGSKPTSAHTKGFATDFTCRKYGAPLVVAQKLAASGIKFDQLIHEYGDWVHISFAPAMRGELLTIDHHGTRPGLLTIR